MNSGIHYSHVSEGTAHDPDRERVRELRMQGKEIPQITAETGLPDTQVTDYCRELGLPVTGSCQLTIPQSANHSIPICPVCGRQIRQGLIGRQRKYCSDYCRNRAGYLRRQKALKNRCVCENCGKVFYPAVLKRAKPQKFCCRECYFEKRYGFYWCKQNAEHMSNEEERP